MFATHGAALISNGYWILPIAPRQKYPIGTAWEQQRISHSDHARMAANGAAEAGLGILTGQPNADGIAVTMGDIDTHSPDLALAMRAWLDDHAGITVERVGKAPKLGLVYQAPPGLSKIKSDEFFDPGHEGDKDHKHQLEWLNRGQQFVAYGIHPSTGKQYEQGGLLGTLADIPARDLPMVTEDTMRAAVAHFEALATAMGLVRGSGSSSARGKTQTQVLDSDKSLVAAFQSVAPPVDITLEDIRSKLAAIDPDDYDDWVTIGMALHHHFAGSEQGLALWDEWSQGSVKYEGIKEITFKWRSFDDPNRAGRPAVTLRTLIKQANDAIREQAVEQQVAATGAAISALATYRQRLVDAGDEQDVRVAICGDIRRDSTLEDIDREQLAHLVQDALRRITGTRLPIGTMRGLVALQRADGGWPDTDEDGNPRRTWRNVQRVLDQSGCTVRYNVVTKEQDVLIQGLHLSPDNAADSSAGWIVSRCEEMGLMIDPARVRTFVKLIADQVQFSPVTTWIRSRPWDGVSRLQQLYDTVDSPMDSDPAQKHLKELMIRKWMLYAVGAAFSREGLAGRGVLTFTGAQYIGKTRWLRSLVPADTPGMFLEGHLLDPRSKDTVKAAISHWLVELGEVDATFRKADIAALKAFLTLKTDTIRLPYAVGESKFPRRTAFCASVNEEQFLSDQTGNTRFWAIPVNNLNHEHGIDIQQVWAEVLDAWNKGEQHWLDTHDMHAVAKQAEQHAEVNPIEELLTGKLDWDAPQDTWTWETATHIAGMIHLPRLTKGEVTTVGICVMRLNGGRKKRTTKERLLLCPPAKNAPVF